MWAFVRRADSYATIACDYPSSPIESTMHGYQSQREEQSFSQHSLIPSAAHGNPLSRFPSPSVLCSE